MSICDTCLHRPVCAYNAHESFCPSYLSGGKYLRRILAIFTRQREKGLRTYGQTLEDNYAPVAERLDYISEELVDALQYIEWLKEGLQDAKDKKSMRKDMPEQMR